MSITTDDEQVRRIFEPACAPIVARLEAIRTVREAGIPTQVSIAPLLPCNAERLARLLDPAVDWVVVSTFRDDGGNGDKTRPWAAQLYRDHGYGSHLHDGDAQAEATIETLRRVLGPERGASAKMASIRFAVNWAWTSHPWSKFHSWRAFDRIVLRPE